MTPETLQSLRAEAVRAGVVDPDVVTLVDPAMVAKVEGGQLTAAQAITDFRAAKPGFFKPTVAKMNAADYRAHKANMLRDLRQPGDTAIPAPAKPLAEMTRREFSQHRRATISTLARRGRR